MQRNFRIIFIITAIALVALLLSQGIWIRNAMHQRVTERSGDFQQCFKQSINNHVNELMGKNNDTPFNIEPMDSVQENDGPAIHMGKPTASYTASELIEAALIILWVEEGRFRLTRLDSIINDCITGRMGKVITSNLLLLNSEGQVLDSTGYVSDRRNRRSVKTYTAERKVSSVDRSYTIRAEYSITEPTDLRDMGITTLVSLLASIIIITVLFYLLYVIKRRHNEIENMERSFHGAIHDLKSPLAYVYLSLTSLVDNETNIAKRGELSLTADKVSFLTGKISHILQSGKDIGKILVTSKKKVFLYDMVEQVEAEIRSMFPEKDIHFNKTQLTPDHMVMASPDLMETVLRILLENAVKYGGDNPVVNIKVRHEGKECKIDIEDNGIGISKKNRRKLFRPYYTTDNKQGTGIGLYYAKKIIKAHGGDISVFSDPGKGSIFTIILPNV